MPVRLKQLGACVAAFALLLFWAAVPVRAAEGSGVPAAVLEAKDGVLRIVISGEYGMYTGTGFAVGQGSRVYIVTNHHVIEGAETIYILYNTGEYVTGKIVHDDPTRDICVLKPDEPLPDIKLLDLETGVVESGIGVYALGFPGAADYFSMDFSQEFADEEEFLAAVTADKQSMTITDGIVSALHSSKLIGDGSRDVDVLQTNTAINGGNSGGPLLNSAGRVVGVNTMGIIEAESMNGAVHITELIRVLRAANVPYGSGTAATEGSGPAPAEEDKTLLVLLLAAMAVIAVGGSVAAVAAVRRQKKRQLAGGLALADFEKSYRRVEEVASLEMVLRFVNTLLPLARYDLSALLTPDNVIIGDSAIVLKDDAAKPSKMGAPPVYAGYSAPEAVQSGRMGPAAQVYFMGALLYTMLTGVRPPDAPARLAGGGAVFPDAASPAQALVNCATEPAEQNRIGDLYALATAMQETLAMLGQRPGY